LSFFNLSLSSSSICNLSSSSATSLRLSISSGGVGGGGRFATIKSLISGGNSPNSFSVCSITKQASACCEGSLSSIFKIISTMANFTSSTSNSTSFKFLAIVCTNLHSVSPVNSINGGIKVMAITLAVAPVFLSVSVTWLMILPVFSPLAIWLEIMLSATSSREHLTCIKLLSTNSITSVGMFDLNFKLLYTFTAHSISLGFNSSPSFC